jgi:glutamate dehydrogenase
MEDLAERGGLNMNLYRPLEAPPGMLRFKLFWADRPLPLSDAVPMLEDMGVRVVEERPYELHPAGHGPVWIHDFGIVYTGPEGDVDIGRVRDIFQEAFAAILRGEAESDGFNRLVLRARLTWRQIVVLRAYCKYLRQTRLSLSQEYMEQALANNPQIARGLVELFESRFDPTQVLDAEARAEELRARLGESIDQVANLDEDRILRSFLGMVEASLRTNFYQTGLDGQPKPYHSFKLDPTQVPSLPKPRPMFEVFVYSPRTEAVHLRGGRVARGGIRWSDRREDFRTEILGLMKAQMVKNAVIVPVGAKGGFVVKQPPAGGGREALQEEVVACPRRTWSATTTTTRTWWWRPTRARPPSPTWPTRSPPSTASGWTTPSPPAARPATTTRRWASPPGAPGSRSSSCSASSGSTPRRPTSPWSASATCPATCSATACC